MFDRYFYAPTKFQKVVAHALLPLSALYLGVSLIKRARPKKEYKIPIVSVGNLIVGGTGKTPVLIELAKRYKKCGVITRGYKRESKGIYTISKFGALQEEIRVSGDEAMLIAKMLPEASVVVAENRYKGIERAIELGCEVIFLDDAFRWRIDKFDIVTQSKERPYYNFTLPSGAYKEPSFLEKSANLVLIDGVDYLREVEITNKMSKMALVCGIANPKRLEIFLKQHKSNIVSKHFFEDHYDFKKSELEQILKTTKADSLLVTRKDWVKMEFFKLPLSIMELNIDLKPYIVEAVDRYISNYKNIE